MTTCITATTEIREGLGCLGIEQAGDEDVVGGQQAPGHPLLVVVAQERVDGLAVGAEAVGPPVFAEQRPVLGEQLAEPRG
jgi:hypothetical protein